MTVILLTSASSSPWTKPGDWSDSGHTVELVGAGGNGGAGTLGGSSSTTNAPGGGGGAYVALAYSSGAMGASTSFAIKGVGAATDTANHETAATYWENTTNTNSYEAQAGLAGTGTSSAAGGISATNTNGSPSPITYTVSNNKDGGSSGSVSGTNIGASGGGGGGGPSGAGGGSGNVLTAALAGSGGGGSNGGGASLAPSGTSTGSNGGAGGDGGAGGAGGNSAAGSSATTAGGGGGGGGGGGRSNANVSLKGGNGATETDWTQTSDSSTAGSGGGGGGGGSVSGNGGGASSNVSGGDGANYGAGGGGGGGQRSGTVNQAGGNGGGGLIVITYTVVTSFTITPPAGTLTLTTGRPQDELVSLATVALSLTGNAPVLYAYTVLSPDGDNSTGAWLNELNGLPLWPSIDEYVRSDSDYIRSAGTPSADVASLSISNPAVSVGMPFTVLYRYRKEGADRIDLTVRLKQGTTTIVTWTHTDISTGVVEAAQNLSAGQFSSITDFNNLFVEFEANKV